MAKQHLFCEVLIPLRPTFPFDMTADERAVMMEHVKYTHEKFAAGKVLIFGLSDGARGRVWHGGIRSGGRGELREITEQ